MTAFNILPQRKEKVNRFKKNYFCFLLFLSFDKKGDFMLIKNVNYIDKNFNKVSSSIRIQEGKIQSFSDEQDNDIVDMGSLTALPGFVDIHSHGGSGCDFCDGTAESLHQLSLHYARNGVTSVCPTTMTLPVSELERIFSAIETFKGSEPGAYFHPINMEGPFISKEKCGAQDPENILLPDVDLFHRLHKISPVALVDVAPESEGVSDFANAVKGQVTLSVAHTNATYQQTVTALENGFSHATHFLNAMTPFTSRAPGVAGAFMENESATAEIICDGYHLAEGTLRILFNIFGEDRLCVISDSMSSAGCPDGEYYLGGQKVYVTQGKAHLKDGTIAGSTTNMFCEFRNLLNFGIPFRSALKACTINPARVIGADDICGSIEEGKNADMIFVDENMNLKKVMVRGRFFDI